MKQLIVIFSLLALSFSCTKEESNEPAAVCDDPDYELTLSAIGGVENGKAYMHITQVWGDYMPDLSFKWSNGDTGPRLDDVEPGIYSVTVTNPQGCSYTEEYDLTLNTSSGYQVGDEGPAGGLIFYVYSDGSALEAAPSSSIASQLAWGCEGSSINTAQSRGSGQSNTNNILNNCSESDIAAEYCDELSVNGYSDWYLPSVDELDRLAFAVYQDNPDNYPEGEYWSSSEALATMAYQTFLPDGGSGYANKSALKNVIAIRDVAAP